MTLLVPPIHSKAKRGGPYRGCDAQSVRDELTSLFTQIPAGPPANVFSFKMPEPGHAIYLLLRKGRVVYVGQSISMLGRLGSHSQTKRRPFDEVQYVILPSRRCLAWAEFTLIRKFRPPYNRVVPSERELAKATYDASMYFDQRHRALTCRKGNCP
jgi:hypothetical protein